MQFDRSGYAIPHWGGLFSVVVTDVSTTSEKEIIRVK